MTGEILTAELEQAYGFTVSLQDILTYRVKIRFCDGSFSVLIMQPFVNCNFRCSKDSLAIAKLMKKRAF